MVDINPKLKELMDSSLGCVPEEKEKEENEFTQKIPSKKECPYGKCDGSGFLLTKENKRVYSEWCKCHLDEVWNYRLKESNIPERYWNVGMNLTDTTAKSLHKKPKNEIQSLEKKTTTKRGSKPEEETNESYIFNFFTIRKIKDINYFGENYTQVSKQYLDAKPRENVQNVVLMGEPGLGKTHLAIAIGREYLKNDKTVYFTTVHHMLQNLQRGMKKDGEEIAEKTLFKVLNSDLLILDELGYEHHTDSKWAIKQIKDLFRDRYNKKMPIICTTNLYPKELKDLYDKALLSVLEECFYIWMERENGDYRLEEAKKRLQDFDFLGEEL